MSKGVRRWLFWLGGLVLFGCVVVIVLPPVFCSRERLPRIDCANNLKQVGLGLKMWAGDHGEVYPNKVEECSRAALLICPSSGSELVFPLILDNVGAWMDYTYVPGLPESVPPDTVLMYCPAKNHKGDGGNVLFADGHVSWFNTQKHCGEGQTSFEEVIGTIGERPL